MTTTAAHNLDVAHKAIFAVAQRASVALAGHEGLGVTLSFADIAASIGVDLAALSRTDSFLTLLALEAAIEYRKWIIVSEPGELKRFRKLPATRHHRKASISPTARARARARA